MCPPQRSASIINRALHLVGLQKETRSDYEYEQTCWEIAQAGGGGSHKGPNQAEEEASCCHKALVSLNIKRAYRPYPQHDPFYCISAHPSALSAYKPGHILKYRPIQLTPFPGIEEDQMKVWQIAYVYHDADDKPGVSVLVVIVPPNSNRDKILAQLPKTDAAIPQCRTSYSMRKGSAARFASLSESVFLGSFLDRGWICFLPDYMGQQDSFGNGPLCGRCTLDAARAVLNFAPLELKPERKLAFWGYSSGAQAAAWAASEQTAYAPELTGTIVGWAAGGLPVDPLSCAYHMNESIAAGLIVGVMAGLSNVFPPLKEWLASSLTPDGVKLFGKAKESCFAGFMIASLLKDVLGSSYFKRDKPLEEATPREILDTLVLGKTSGGLPSQPVWILGSLHDEVVPIRDLDNFVNTWAERGANIEYTRDRLSAHVILCFTGFPATIGWLDDRFDGKETRSKSGHPHIRTVDTTLWLDDDDDDQGKDTDIDRNAKARVASSLEDNPKRNISMHRRRQLRRTLQIFKAKGYFY